jgi:hypothetical protein
LERDGKGLPSQLFLPAYCAITCQLKMYQQATHLPIVQLHICAYFHQSVKSLGTFCLISAR